MLRKTKMAIASSLLALWNLASAEGLPGMRGTDHIGITGPDLKQVVESDRAGTIINERGDEESACFHCETPNGRSFALFKITS